MVLFNSWKNKRSGGELTAQRGKKKRRATGAEKEKHISSREKKETKGEEKQEKK